MNKTLYFRQGASDKVYQAHINKVGNDEYTVNFAYGRRGSTLQTGSKTKSPVSYEKAVTIFNKLIASKVAKGYTEGEDGSVFSDVDKEHTGIACQLLNPVERVQALALFKDDNFCAQTKFDGERRLIQYDGRKTTGINRKGYTASLSQTILDSLETVTASAFLIDGEIIGDTYYAFDILSLNGEDICCIPYKHRYIMLKNLLVDCSNDSIVVVDTAFTADEKQALFNLVEDSAGEGLVFKDIHAEYTPGRPNSMGSQLKHKFYATCSIIVQGHSDSKRSISTMAYTGSTPVPLGNVTIPPNHDIPDIGDIVEVRYLYAYRNGSLYQPVYLGKRSDLCESDCTTEQLKYKAEDAA